MESRSKESYIRMPARKLRRVINEVRGKKVSEALNILKFMPYFAAKVVEKNLVNAMANASEKWGAVSDNLVVSEIYADDGPMLKRAKPRAQGRIYRILKRTSHLTVKVKVVEETK
jgi:large subunit ribosomal protein L22